MWKFSDWEGKNLSDRRHQEEKETQQKSQDKG